MKSRIPMKKLMKAGKARCHWCQRPVTYQPNRPNSATREHLIPRSRRGKIAGANVTLACLRCNHIKGNLLPQEFSMLMAGIDRRDQGYMRRWAIENPNFAAAIHRYDAAQS